MGVTITTAERDALYALIINRFAGDIDALLRAERSGNWEECYRLGRRVTDGLRLIQDGGLEWGGESFGGDIELRLPPDDLKRILTSLRREAILWREGVRPEHEEQIAEWEGVQLAATACTNALDQARRNGS
jgi:hypothetical protein